MSEHDKQSGGTELDDEQLDAVSGGTWARVSKLASAGTSKRMGNFEIQDLMSQFNQAETLASSVQKKQDDAAKAVIGKIG